MKLSKSIICILSITLIFSLTACNSSSSNYESYDNNFIDSVKGKNSVDSADSILEMKTSANADSMSMNGIVSALGGSLEKSESQIIQDESGADFTEDQLNNKTQTSEDVEINTEKLVYTAYMEVETREFDETVKNIRSQISEYDGFIEYEVTSDNSYWVPSEQRYSNTDDRRFNISVRIPTERFEEFTTEIGGIGHLKSLESTVDNISRQYYDTRAYLESYKNQLETLQDMYVQATTIEEMLNIQDRIAEVQGEINALTTEIQGMDLDVAYSTVHIAVDEVRKYSDTRGENEPIPFFEELGERWLKGWDTFASVIRAAIMTIVEGIWVIAIIAIVVYLIIRKIKKGETKRRIKKQVVKRKTEEWFKGNQIDENSNNNKNE